jgi:hypothetical protein
MSATGLASLFLRGGERCPSGEPGTARRTSLSARPEVPCSDRGTSTDSRIARRRSQSRRGGRAYRPWTLPIETARQAAPARWDERRRPPGSVRTPASAAEATSSSPSTRPSALQARRSTLWRWKAVFSIRKGGLKSTSRMRSTRCHQICVHECRTWRSWSKEPHPGQRLLGLYQGVSLTRRRSHLRRGAAGQDHDLPRPARPSLRAQLGDASPGGRTGCPTSGRPPLRDQRRTPDRNRPLLRRSNQQSTMG